MGSGQPSINQAAREHPPIDQPACAL